MISVHASEADHPVVREFFELFKTPWRFHAPDSPAEILLCNGAEIPANAAVLVIVFNGGPENGVEIFQDYGIEMPVYGRKRIDPSTRKIIFQRQPEKGRTLVQIGYDLFAEIHHLLTAGQPEQFAAIPTLERHIALLRNLILSHGLPLRGDSAASRRTRIHRLPHA